MRTVRLVAASVVAAASCLTPTGSAGSVTGLTPSVRSVVAPGRISALGLTGRHVAFAVGETSERCPSVELWLPESSTRLRFPWALRGCKDRPSTGFGIPSVELARARVVWLSYIGGNLRDWQLWTATPTKRTPRLLRFVERDVDRPPPIVIGPGTPRGVPYAVDRRIVYLGDDGRARFDAVVGSPVRLLAAGTGPERLEVAAVLEDGRVVGLDGAGNELDVESLPPGEVTAVRVTALGIAVQSGDTVRFFRPSSGERVSVGLPPGSAMLDVAQRRILLARAGDLFARPISSARTIRVVDASPALPATGQIDQSGLVWARTRTLRWRPGALP